MNKPTFRQGVLEAEEMYNKFDGDKTLLQKWFERECEITVEDPLWSSWRDGVYFYLCHIEKNSIKPRNQRDLEGLMKNADNEEWL